MAFKVYPKLTMKYILQRVSQEDIFEKYCNTRVVTNTKVSSPFRHDPNPSCQFYYTTRNKLKLRDFNPNGFHGDCFDAAAEILNLDCSNKYDMFKVMDDIARRFFIHRYEDEDALPMVINYQKKESYEVKKKVHIINVKVREWANIDNHIWKKIGKNVSLDIIKYFNIFPCQKVWIDGEQKYHFTPADPCYAYYFGVDDEGNRKITLYFPRRKKGQMRFYINNSAVQGESQIFPAEFGLVTKSLKDIVSAFTFGITSIAPSGEGTPLPPEPIFKLKQFANHIVSLYDFDKSGISGAFQLRNQYGINPIFFAENPYSRGLGYKGAKDLSDFCVMHGVTATEDLIERIKEKYYSDIEKYNNYYYQSLNFLK